MTAQPLRPNDAIAPLPTVPGGFKTVMADPPWRFQNRTGKVAPEHRRLDRYSTLSLDDICALPVQDVVADDAHLYLWVPNALLPDGMRVMEEWGFRYVSNIVWAKRRKDGGPAQLAQGADGEAQVEEQQPAEQIDGRCARLNDDEHHEGC